MLPAAQPRLIHQGAHPVLRTEAAARVALATTTARALARVLSTTVSVHPNGA
jgi:hypothetical protein